MVKIEEIKMHVPKAVSPEYHNEATLVHKTKMGFTEETTGTKIPNLEAKITSHRLILYHLTNTVFNFEWEFDQIHIWKVEKRGNTSQLKIS
jgi:hypothetical protein